MGLRDPPADRSPADRLSFGVINLDKPPGPSAHQVADWVREMVGDALADRGRPRIDRVAHGGTLDPKVTGCLPVLVGTATRLAQVFSRAPKAYVAVLELHQPAPDDFAAVVAEFEGEVYQKPPKTSAVARRLRTREISSIDILEREPRRALLRIRCEAGTYIRKLCHDIGMAAGTGAHMGDLRRTSAGVFDDTDMVRLEDVADALAFWTADDETGPVRDVVRPAEDALRGLPRLTIAPTAARAVANGAPVYAPGVLGSEPAPVGAVPVTQGTQVACFTPEGSAVCLGTLVGDPSARSGTVVDLDRVLV